MAAFLTELLLRDDGTGDSFTLIQPLVYRSTRHGTRLITVPANFTTDFASVPRGLWNILPKMGPWDKASVIHDFLYQTGSVPKATADAIFSEAMSISGVPTWKRWTMYLAVSFGGGRAWQRYRDHDQGKD